MTETLAWLSASLTSYLLIFAAEIGDKSQLVCMVLAARHRPLPIILGAAAAFALLNALAVMFGMGIASLIPEFYISLIVAVLFAAFGIHALRAGGEDEGEEELAEKSGRSVFLTTFLLISVAEFGDKTQIAVVALSSTSIPLAVWVGATLALASTSALGVWAGRTILQKMPLKLLHQISGVLFLLLAAYAAYTAYQAW
ncbi:MAG: hypothetical protein COW19_05075 [Zetaproteobacteria bacterium CG12_big_fil_rev_8_21_14_0_65_55_1124]|nr:MAG: UPF0016 family membrane protein [Zetaproteobacteria bacterium CG1_02_55_237]PIS18515.1 MAG: hypothetical protein COT53_10575 [Zetaproteobacteria bacterium CG08_land_8_20_14_0_20_55_17]PIW43049.1 MAG: hypothetical protein COW19_05075 [Zetaproteobacteria bacterium CG12_big_fil_rev_8_21_14_0_65_55_1124]PIY52584.1 MAG: hypothetical protein COZ01_07030 [Zetaproteobacteria bacterium CG_4_10_14_0_8_um_filter_55_43]PIZ38429.1 MAG: hypothetical protein COY36_06200 [Zetaproteobacteria bacterium C